MPNCPTEKKKRFWAGEGQRRQQKGNLEASVALNDWRQCTCSMSCHEQMLRAVRSCVRSVSPFAHTLQLEPAALFRLRLPKMVTHTLLASSRVSRSRSPCTAAARTINRLDALARRPMTSTRRMVSIRKEENAQVLNLFATSKSYGRRNPHVDQNSDLFALPLSALAPSSTAHSTYSRYLLTKHTRL
jgi:hypothetical protein